MTFVVSRQPRQQHAAANHAPAQHNQTHPPHHRAGCSAASAASVAASWANMRRRSGTGVFHASSRTGTPSSHPKADCTDSSATSRTLRLARIKPYSAISQNLAMSGLPARVHLRCHTCRLRRDAHIRIRDDEAAWWGSTLQTVSALLWWASAIGGVFAWTVLLAKLQHRPFARARPAQPPAPWHPPPPYPPTEYPQQPPQP